jgi:hypothetical protein
VDDAEARIAASRFQDFDSWAASQPSSPIPDWAVTQAKPSSTFPVSPTGGCPDLQVHRRTGNNKAIEIFNGTEYPIDLGANAYVLQQINNGLTTSNLFLTGSIPNGGTLVVSRPSTLDL